MNRSLLGLSPRLPAIQSLLLGAAGFAVVVAVWGGFTALGWVPRYFLPTPTEVLIATKDLFLTGGLLRDIGASFYRVGVGFLLSVVVGLPLGIMVGVFPRLAASVEPLNDFVRYTPLPAFIPLVILWTGIGDLNQISIVFLGVVWTLIVLVAEAVAGVPRELVETAYTLGTRRRDVVLFVVIPAAMPLIYDGLRIGVGWAWSSVILAEVVGANTGIGHMIMEAQRFLKTANVIAGIVVVGALGVIMDAVFRLLARPLFPWSEKAQR